MIRNVIKMGHPSLMTPTTLVQQHEFKTPELTAAIQDMTDTLKHSKGVGIAANQVNITKRIMIIGFNDNSRYPNEKPLPITALINPHFIPLTSEMNEGWEGCLSLPGLRGMVPRYTQIFCEYKDAEGNPQSRVASGFEARIIQHECDHLDGITFPARIKDFSKFVFEDSYPEFTQNTNRNDT